MAIITIVGTRGDMALLCRSADDPLCMTVITLHNGGFKEVRDPDRLGRAGTTVKGVCTVPPSGSPISPPAPV